jgi:hypothetical protein
VNSWSDSYLRCRLSSSGARVVAAGILVAAAIAGIAAGAPSAFAAELRYEVRHERFLRDHRAVVTFDNRGLTFEPVGKNGKPVEKERRRWDYADIQQLWLSPAKLVVLTYEDRKWLLGSDREFELFAVPGTSFESAYALLKDRLDQRFTAALAEEPKRLDWSIRAKRLGAFKGSEGVLEVGEDQVVYRSDLPTASRSWRYEDIENVSQAGPFQLTITTYERAILQYGSMKAFNFQLKQPLDEARFEMLWKRLQRGKGLSFLSAIEDGTRRQ